LADFADFAARMARIVGQIAGIGRQDVPLAAE
jgi:hypothetical protein